MTVHRKSRKVDFDVLQSLTKIPIHTIYYQSETELEYNLSHTDCDCVIGAALANEIAERLGLKGILIYEGEYTIRSSIDQARNLAAELQSASRKESITNAIIRNVPAGIIITDENGRITTFNKQAKKLTGFQEQKLRGQFLSDVIPSLSYAAFYKSGQIQSDRKHLFDGAMVRCIQTRLLQGDQQIGMLTTLQADNSRRKKMDSTREFFAHHQWKDVLGTSSVIRRGGGGGQNAGGNGGPCGPHRRKRHRQELFRPVHPQRFSPGQKSHILSSTPGPLPSRMPPGYCSAAMTVPSPGWAFLSWPAAAPLPCRAWETPPKRFSPVCDRCFFSTPISPWAA